MIRAVVYQGLCQASKAKTWSFMQKPPTILTTAAKNGIDEWSQVSLPCCSQWSEFEYQLP